MGNISPKGIEPTCHAFLASVLTIKLPRLPDVITLPTPTCQCGHLILMLSPYSSPPPLYTLNLRFWSVTMRRNQRV